MNEELQHRLGRNEALFREINEGIERGRWPGEERSPVSFRCECALLGCVDMISLSVNEYERVRAHPQRFIVAPGHEQVKVETVVESFPGYLVVEKRGQAGIVARDSDPRG